jgi:hypothetical protein
MRSQAHLAGLVCMVSAAASQTAAPGDGPACPSACLADLDASTVVDVGDVLQVLASFGVGCAAECAGPPQPKHPAPPDLACAVAIVGAGPGGAYLAWRLATDVGPDAIEPASVCVFERTARLGGRVYSLTGLGDSSDLVVDAGAYRYEPGQTPLLASLIEGALGLPHAAYDSTHEKIVTDAADPDSNAGYATFVHAMMDAATAAGVRLYTDHELRSVAQPEHGAAVALSFANGRAVAAGTLCLNLAQQPLLQVLARSTLAASPPGAPRGAGETALYLPSATPACKLYLHYPTAWWRTELGLTAGNFAQSAPAMEMPLNGRYHDGHARCRPDGSCYGFLLAVYSNGASACAFFKDFVNEADPPVSVVRPESSAGAWLLAEAHAQLVRKHPAMSAAARAAPPTFGVLSLWNERAAGFGAGWHGWKTSAASRSAPAQAVRPWAAAPIFVANEAFGTRHGWAESSVVMAENIAAQAFGLVRPAWLPEATYSRVIF